MPYLPDQRPAVGRSAHVQTAQVATQPFRRPAAPFQTGQADWSGLLPAGALERTVLARRPLDPPGAALAVWSARGDQVRVSPARTAALQGGGVVLPAATGSGPVTVLTGGPVIGSQRPGRGLLAVPQA